MGMSFDGASYPVFGPPAPTPLSPVFTLLFWIDGDNKPLSWAEMKGVFEPLARYDVLGAFPDALD
jgi:hypothetical protein